MKLASYKIGGAEKFGAVVGDGVVDLNERLGGKYADLKALIAAGVFAKHRCAISSKPRSSRERIFPIARLWARGW